MADVFTKEKRSEVMSKIRGINTKPEILVRQFLFSNGFRYRIHKRNLTGNPDIVLKKYQTVIFVHGCFWHGHSSIKCKISRIPKTNTTFWEKKITYNQSRHINNVKELRRNGWRVITVWECQLKGIQKMKTLDSLLDKIQHYN